MTALDYFVIAVVGGSLVFGLVRGIIKASITLLACIVGLVAAGQFYGYAGSALKPVVSSTVAADFFGFVIILAGVLVAGLVVSRLMRHGLKRVRMSWLDHLLGGGFGLVRGWLICSAVYLALTAFPVKLDAVEQARLSGLLLEGTRAIAYLASPPVRAKFQDGYGLVAGAKDDDSKKSDDSKKKHN